MDLQVSSARRGSFAVLTVVGEVDLNTSGHLADEVSTATSDESANLVVDLGGVTFLDSSGLKVLVSTLKRTEQGGKSMSLVAVPRAVMRVLTVTALDKVFSIYDSVDDAVGADFVTDIAYDVDREVEFDRQVATLVEKGYPGLTGLAEADFVALLKPLRDAVAELPPPGGEDRIPFVLVVPGPARELAFARVDLRGRPGFTTMEPDDLARFGPIADVDVPAAAPYLLADIDTGQGTLDVPPDDAMPTILAAGRSPLTLDEGIAVVTHNPDLLGTGNRFSMLGSRCGDRRVTAIWVSQRRPRLGWCWAGAPHTWLGSASCGSRVG